MRTIERATATGDGIPVEASGRRPSLTVLAWGAVGLTWLVISLSGWGRWILSDDFVKAPVGRDPIPDLHLFWIRVIDWASAGAGLALAWLGLIRPLLKRQGLTPDGMIFLACAVSFFIDPVINQFEYTFAWNAHTFNMGTWSAYVPFHSGLAGFGEGLAWAWAQYLYMDFGAAVLGTWIVGRIRRRSPGISNLSAFGLLWAFWSGSQYQFPVYESIFVATFAVGWTYFRVDWREHGRPFVAGGQDRLAVGRRTGTALTLLAVVGFGSAWVALTYFVPWSWLSVNADSVARLPSYMLPG